MSIFVFANNIRTTLVSALSSSATTMTLASGSGLPTLQTDQVMPLTLNDAATGLVYETVYATAISGTSVTITRGQEGTIAASWLAGDYVSCDPTAWAIGQLGMGNNLFQPDQGNANAYVTKNPVPFTAFVDGMIAGIQVVNANTGASTFQTDGLAAMPIYGKALQSLQGGEIVAGAMLLQYRAALSAWVILVSPGGALQVGNATQSLQALNLAIGDGRYVLQSNLASDLAPYELRSSLTGDVEAFSDKRYSLKQSQAFTSSGTFTFTAPVTGIYKAIVTGGGGGGGGCQASGATYTFAGAGGGAGGTAIDWVTLTVGQQVTVTVGAGGAGGVGANSGNNGGTSSFGSYVSATGGAKGTKVNTTSTSGGSGGIGTGGVLNLAGGDGSDGQAGASLISGDGGASFWGGGGRGGSGGGIIAICPGSGGGGAYDMVFSGTAYNGAAGATGIVTVEW